MFSRPSAKYDIQTDRSAALQADGRIAGKSFYAGIALVFIVSLAIYSNTLQNGFVYDDAWQVVKNSWIRDFRFIPEIVSSDVWKFSGDTTSHYYRPMMYLIYMVTYSVAGLDPRAFHLLNVLLNAMISVLVFMTTVKLLQQFLPAKRNIIFPAFAASVLFAAHPVHTEVVAWIAAIPELTYSLFCLLSFYCYARTRDKASRRISALSVAAFFVATFCKEPALLLPVILIIYDYCLGKTRGEKLVRIRRYVPYLIAAAIYLSIRAFAIGSMLQQSKHQQLNAYEVFINIFPLFGSYLAKLIWPANLNAYTVFNPVSSLFTPQVGVVVIGALLFLVFWLVSYRKGGLLFLGLSLIPLPLLPALYIPALPENIFAERYLYLPSFGFVLLIALILTKIRADQSNRFAGAAVLVAAVAVLYSFGTIKRNAVWKDNVSFYADVLKKSPDVPMMHVNLGWTYFKMGLIDAAIREYRIAIDLKPDLAEPHNNIGLIYEQQGLTADAINEYKVALSLDPDYPAAHNNLGNVYVRLNQVSDAILEFQTALRLSPRYTVAHYNLANAYAMSGLLDEAVREYLSALELEPDEVDARNNLGVTYLKLNRFNEAREQFNAALKINPHFIPARQNLERIVVP